MTCGNLQIVNAYEELGLSTEEIAAALDYPLASVKMVLASESSKYRIASQRNDADTFTDQDKEEAKLVMLSLMRSSDADAVRYRSARYVLDDKAGRLDVNKLAGTNISISIINERLAEARKAIELAKEKPIVNVESQPA